MLLLASCATPALKQEIELSPYLTETTWKTTNYPGWKEFHFLVVHNPTNKTISTTVDCETYITLVVVPPKTEKSVLLNDGEEGKCTTRY